MILAVMVTVTGSFITSTVDGEKEKLVSVGGVESSLEVTVNIV